MIVFVQIYTSDSDQEQGSTLGRDSHMEEIGGFMLENAPVDDFQ